LRAALAGLGRAYLPEDRVTAHVADGRLIRVLSEWRPAFSVIAWIIRAARHPSPALALIADFLRYRSCRDGLPVL
jgi:DNA-binding transcriptional LysR family regulator